MLTLSSVIRASDSNMTWIAHQVVVIATHSVDSENNRHIKSKARHKMIHIKGSSNSRPTKTSKGSNSTNRLEKIHGANNNKVVHSKVIGKQFIEIIKVTITSSTAILIKDMKTIRGVKALIKKRASRVLPLKIS